MKAYERDQKILNLLADGEEWHTKQILAALPEEDERRIKERLALLKKRGKIEMPQRSRYICVGAESNALRAAEDNEKTIDTLLNLYDDHVKAYKAWAEVNIGSGTDFQEQLAFMENFRALTMIVDRLMKRWALVHMGYDANSRQAQEDAKAKTEERQKEALKDAPLEDRIQIVGSYDPAAKELIDCVPSSLKARIDEDAEKIKG